jgi:hypothetical protein
LLGAFVCRTTPAVDEEEDDELPRDRRVALS